MSFLQKKSKIYLGSFLSAVLVVGTLVPTFSYAYKVVDDKTFRVMPSIKVSSSDNFKVKDTLRIEPRKVIISQKYREPVAESKSQGPDGSEKYDASRWLLARTYDELVQSGSSEESFLASAPEQPKIHREDPVLNIDPPVAEEPIVEKDSVNISQGKFVDETVLITAKPVKTESIKLQPKRVIRAQKEVPPLKKLMVEKLYTSSDLPLSDGLFKMSAPLLDEEVVFDRSCHDKYQYLVGPSPWEQIAYKLIFFIHCLLIVVYLLIMLVLLMILRNKKTTFSQRILAIFRQIKKNRF